VVLSVRTTEVFRSALLKTDILVFFTLDVPQQVDSLIQILLTGQGCLPMEKFSQGI